MTERRQGLYARFPVVGAVILLVLAPNLAQAYVGPGVGLSALGSVLAFIGAVFLLIVGFAWYPIKRLLKRGSKPPADEAAAGGSDTHRSDES
jgi:hypothetical protein